MRLLILTSTSLTTPSGYALDRSANWIMTLVYFRGPSFKDAYTEWGMTFIDAPKSSIACSILWFLIVHGIVNIPRSLYFWDNLRWLIAVTFSLTLRISLPFNFFFEVQSFFRNFVYLGTCLIALKRGIFILTF